MTTIDRASDVLRALCSTPTGSQLLELEQETGLPKPTLYRMLRNLMQHDLCVQAADGRYRPGPAIFDLAATSYTRVAVTQEMRELVVRLGTEVGLSIHVSMFRGGDLVYVDKYEGTSPFQLRSEVGRIQPIHSSSIGKSVLAHLPPDRAANMLAERELAAFTPGTVTDVATILGALPAVRARGYAIDDEEDELSTRAIGVALLADNGMPFGGVSMVTPSFELTLLELEAHAPRLIETARDMQVARPLSWG